MKLIRVLAAATLLATGAVTVLAEPTAAPAADQVQAITEWQSFITPAQLKAKLDDPKVLVIDVRAADEYAAGHIPGAINIPGEGWRTPSAKPGKGDSQYIFRKEDGSPDVARYEKLLGDAGVTREHEIVVYGNHAGKADGSVPAMILHWLGHEKVQFLDGVGMSEWYKAGYEATNEPRTLPASTYTAQPIEGFVWTLDDVKQNIGNDKVVFYDTRSAKEYTGEDLRGNKRGGHLPGAVLCNFEELLGKDKKTLSPEQVRSILSQKGITPDKQVVLYCQTATRVSLPLLALRDLGYTNISVYDASWHEYGNRDDTIIEGETSAEAQPQTSAK